VAVFCDSGYYRLGARCSIRTKRGDEFLSILPVVILSGVLGSFVSALNRIYSSKDIFPITRYSVFPSGNSM
jgi:hypothetical protein